jgi:integrase
VCSEPALTIGDNRQPSEVCYFIAFYAILGILLPSPAIRARAVPVLARGEYPMASKKLTEATAQNAKVPPGKSRVILWDGAVTGLGLRCSKSGSKAFVLMYRPQGVGRSGPSRTLTLGHWPSLGVEAARKSAKARIGEIAHGKDPAATLRQVRETSRTTLRIALEGFEAGLKRRKVVAISNVMSSLRRGLAGLLRREVATLSRADYVAAIETIERQGKPGAAEYLRKNARTFAEWAVTRGLSPHNPLAGLRRPKATRAERLETESKGRALSDAEILAIWTASGETKGNFGALVRLGLLTGMRRGELAGLRWSDICADRIVLEPRRTKQGRRHQIPLTAEMSALLAARPRGTSDMVFPSWRTNRQMSGWKKLVQGLRNASGVDFSLHDLRRTCRTLMSSLGIAADIAEMAIGHQRSDLIRRYDFSDVWPERVAAFGQVSAHVRSLVPTSSSNVVPIRAGKHDRIRSRRAPKANG